MMTMPVRACGAYVSLKKKRWSASGWQQRHMFHTCTRHGISLVITVPNTVGNTLQRLQSLELAMLDADYLTFGARPCTVDISWGTQGLSRGMQCASSCGKSQT